MFGNALIRAFRQSKTDSTFIFSRLIQLHRCRYGKIDDLSIIWLKRPVYNGFKIFCTTGLHQIDDVFAIVRGAIIFAPNFYGAIFGNNGRRNHRHNE